MLAKLLINRAVLPILTCLIILVSCKVTQKATESSTPPKVEEKTPPASITPDVVHKEQEKYFKSVRQLTYNGDNAEAYWSFDDSKLVLQAKNDKWEVLCDQIFVIENDYDQLANGIPKMLSTGNGRTTCSYFMPGDTSVLYASTHAHDTSCPIAPPRVINGKYVWPIYAEYDIFTADLEGNITKRLTNIDGYDAEATVSPDGKKIVFTSIRNGDLDLYTMNIDGSGVKQITSDLGYDGGGFFSPDSKEIVFRAGRPASSEEAAEYKGLLKQNLIQPTDMEIYIINADGTNLRKITDLGGANWAPYWHPSGEKIIFASNHHSKAGFPFNLFMINKDGSGLEQVSFGRKFDSFPMFSNDGTKLAFSSNRNNGGTRSTNVFIAEWQEPEVKAKD